MSDEKTDGETRIAHLERAVDDLSDEVARLAKSLEINERRIRLLMEREAEREADLGAAPLADQPPPHW